MLVEDMDKINETKPFHSRPYLLDRYGLHMTKRDLCFESRKCRASIDNMRCRGHKTFCAALAAAEIKRGDKAASGALVLFSTPAISDWLDSNSAGSTGS